MCLVRTAAGVPAACFGVRSRVRWLLERVLPWHSDSSNDGDDGAASRQLAVNPARRYGTILLWYGAGVGAIERAFQEHTESWLIARCYRDTPPMLLESSCATEEDAGAAARRQAVTGGASRRGKGRRAAAVGRRCGTALGGGEAARAVLMDRQAKWQTPRE
jgi:hypothetical protein